MAILTVRNQTGDTRQVDESKVSLAEKDGFVPVVSNGTDEKLVKFSNLGLAQKDGFNLLGAKQAKEDYGQDDPQNILPMSKDGIKQFAKSQIEALPMYGAAAGGVIGSVGGPIGAVAGSALGAMGGDSLKSGLLQTFFGEDQGSAKDIVKKQISAGISGATAEAGGQVVGKVLEPVAKLASKAGDYIKNTIASAENVPKQNLSEIQSAATRLGIELPEGVKTSSKQYQDLEGGLAQSGSFAASPIKEKYDAMFKTLKNVSDNISDLSSDKSKFALGQQLGSILDNEVKASGKPVSELYNGLQNELQHIEVNKDSVTRGFGALKKNPIFKTQDGIAFLEKYQNDLLDSSSNLSDLKEFRTNLMGSLPRDASALDKSRLDEVYNTITNIRNRSIGKATETNPYIADAGVRIQKQVGSLLDDLTLADTAHATNLKGINSIKELVGAKQDFNSPSDFLNKLSEMPEEELSKRAANLSHDTMLNIQEKYPSVFQKIKEAKVNDLVTKATDNNQFNAGRFLKYIDQMGEESKNILFSPSQLKNFEDLKTIRTNLPEKIGQSGTPKGLNLVEQFSPSRNAKDLLIKNRLEGGIVSDAVKNIGGFVEGTGKVIQKGSEMATKAIASEINGLNESKAPNATSKWAQTGAKNLQDAGLDQDTINSLSKDQLEEASNYKKGSKSMDKFIEKIQPKSGSNQPNSSMNYPVNVRKNGLVATVFSDKDMKEAISEGWSHGMA